MFVVIEDQHVILLELIKIINNKPEIRLNRFNRIRFKKKYLTSIKILGVFIFFSFLF